MNVIVDFERAILLRPPMKIYSDHNCLYMKYDYALLLLVDMKTTLNEGRVVSGLILQMNKNWSIWLSDPKTTKVDY